jgi:hypothetical protein
MIMGQSIPGGENNGLEGFVETGLSGIKYFYHMGDNPGYKTFLLANDRGDAVVIMTDKVHTALPMQAAKHILSRFPSIQTGVFRCSLHGEVLRTCCFQLAILKRVIKNLKMVPLRYCSLHLPDLVR